MVDHGRREGMFLRSITYIYIIYAPNLVAVFVREREQGPLQREHGGSRSEH
jgi:hypothetical protein